MSARVFDDAVVEAVAQTLWDGGARHHDYRGLARATLSAAADALECATGAGGAATQGGVHNALAAHRWGGVWGDNDDPVTGKFFRCSCGWTHRVDGMNGWDSWVARHDEHVAAALSVAARIARKDGA